MNETKRLKKGAFQVARKIFESEVWLDKPSSWKVIWIYILGNVNHKATKRFKRGEGFFTFSKELPLIGNDITLDMIKKFLSYGRKNGMLSTSRSTRGTRLKVLNYNAYQTLDNYKSTRQSTSEALQEHFRSTPINKNDKNVKNEDTLLPLEKFITLWNSHAKYKGTTKVLNISVRNKLLPECRKVTPDIKKEWLKLEKLGYGQEDYIIAVDNYVREICLRSPKNDYARHRFSCYEFIKQQNGFKKFVNR